MCVSKWGQWGAAGEGWWLRAASVLSCAAPSVLSIPSCWGAFTPPRLGAALFDSTYPKTSLCQCQPLLARYFVQARIAWA